MFGGLSRLSPGDVFVKQYSAKVPVPCSFTRHWQVDRTRAALCRTAELASDKWHAVDRRIVERERLEKQRHFSLCSYSVLLCKRERLSPTTSLLICEALRQSSLTNYSSARIQALATTRLRSQRRRRFSGGRSFCQMLCASSLSLVSPKGTRDHFRFCRIGSV